MRNPRHLACGFGLLLALSAAPARAEDTVITPEAKAHFQAGVSFIDDPDGARYEEAYREFKAAYAISPSWKILGNLGLCAMKLERDGEAIQAFKRYLAEGGEQIEADEKAQVERDTRTLETGVVLVTIESDPPGAIFVDERLPDAGSAVVNRYGPSSEKIAIGVRPGRHRITARLEGYQDAPWNLDATPAGKFENTFKLEKIPEAVGPGGGPTTGPGQIGPTTPVPAERPVPTSVFIVGGLSVALAAGGGVVGFLATDKNKQYKELNSDLHSDADIEEAKGLKEDGEMLNLIADGLFAGAVVGAGVAVVLYATRPTKSPTVGGLTFTPAVGPGVGGGFVSGRF
jgi:hypothetical protein